jgi:uncharacterized protein with GYD domain
MYNQLIHFFTCENNIIRYVIQKYHSDRSIKTVWKGQERIEVGRTVKRLLESSRREATKA